MIVGFSQEIPYQWNNVLTCAIGAILLLATCSLIGIILLICLEASQQLPEHSHHIQQSHPKLPSTGKRDQYSRPICAPLETPPPVSCSISTNSSSLLGPRQESLAVGLKCAVAFSWVLPSLYCVILWLIRHVMHTHSVTWWLKLATVECNLLIVNQTLLSTIFYVVLGVVIKRQMLLEPKRIVDQKAVFCSSQRYVTCLPSDRLISS